jgi:nucleoside-diphosphate-sugar epimerase
MNILITGGGGYIGSLLSELLLKNKHNVTIVDNFIYVENSLAHILHYKKLQIIKSDYRNFNKYKNSLKKSDIIIPLAGLVGAPLCNQNPHEALSINKDNQKNLFKKISNNQIILMPTTNSAYGTNTKGICTEKSKLYPISTYAKHKVEVEKSLMKQKNWVSLRLATVFGMSPRMRTDLLVNDFVHRAFFDKFIVLFESHFKRNYIHVRDVCKVFLHCINNLDKCNKNIFNVGLSSANLSKLELCKEIKKKIDFEIILNEIKKDPDQRNYIVSNKKIENTGFKADYNIQDGISELIKGYECFKYKKYSNI